jgi:hypothetical protein
MRDCFQSAGFLAGQQDKAPVRLLAYRANTIECVSFLCLYYGNITIPIIAFKFEKPSGTARGAVFFRTSGAFSGVDGDIEHSGSVLKTIMGKHLPPP